MLKITVPPKHTHMQTHSSEVSMCSWRVRAELLPKPNNLSLMREDKWMADQGLGVKAMTPTQILTYENSLTCKILMMGLMIP